MSTGASEEEKTAAPQRQRSGDGKIARSAVSFSLQLTPCIRRSRAMPLARQPRRNNCNMLHVVPMQKRKQDAGTVLKQRNTECSEENSFSDGNFVYIGTVPDFRASRARDHLDCFKSMMLLHACTHKMYIKINTYNRLVFSHIRIRKPEPNT